MRCNKKTAHQQKHSLTVLCFEVVIGQFKMES